MKFTARTVLVIMIAAGTHCQGNWVRTTGLTASAGVALYAARGDVRVGYAALVGLPAVVGAVVGTSVQRRLSGGTLTLSFAALLAAVGIWLLAG